MNPKIKQLYDKLDSIFLEYTTHNWKNGWQNEGDRESKELTIQKHVPNNNVFLLSSDIKEINLDSTSLDLEVKVEHDGSIRIDIKFNGRQHHIYYYVDDDLNWLTHQDFIVDLCKDVYEHQVSLRKSIERIPMALEILNLLRLIAEKDNLKF